MQEDRTGLVYQYERTRRAETQGLQGEFIPRIFLFVTFKQVGHQRHLKRISRASDTRLLCLNPL